MSQESAKAKIAKSKNSKIRSVNFADHMQTKSDRKPNWTLGERKNKRGTKVTYRGRETPKGLEL
jgi:hypothetical protein